MLLFITWEDRITSATSEIVGALQAAGGAVNIAGLRATQGSLGTTVGGHPRALRVYAWQVTDNGRATGTERRSCTAGYLRSRSAASIRT